MDLHLRIDPAGPRRAQLEQQLREAIRDGRLRPGTRLPPTRTLAAELGVSRGVAVEAYEQLVAEGWLVSRRGAGTRVADRARPTGTVPPAAGGTVPAVRSTENPGGAGTNGGTVPRCAVGTVPPRFDLRTGNPDLSTFPRAAWLAALGRALRELPDAALHYGDAAGFAPLRETLAQYLGRVRGVVAEPERTIVCGGLYQGLPVLWRTLRERGVERIAVEDPGWRGQRLGAEVAGLQTVPVPVDERGLVVDALPDDVGAVIVTPAHQFPLGVVLAPERRAALVSWARDRGALVVEDDYDAEFRYDREPVGALQGLAPDHVLYAGSASKTLAPALRLGWMVAPGWLAGELAAAKEATDRGTPVLEQAALADLLDRGEIDRHLRRTRRRYRGRRDALVAALAEAWPELELGGVAAGLHLIGRLPADGVRDDAPAVEAAIAAAAAAAGIALYTLHHDCTCVAPQPPSLLLGYAALPEAALGRAARALTAAARSASASPSALSASR